jgi:hypothetical protein
LQQEQQRQMMSKAEDDRAKLWDTISQHAKDLIAQGADPKQILRGMEGPVQALERLTKSSGHDPTLIRSELGMILARPSSVAIEQGGSGGGGQQPQQQAPQQSAFDQGAAPAPYMQGEIGGEGFQSNGPPAQPPAQTAGPAPEVSSVLDEKIERGFRALRVAETPHRAKELEMKLAEWIRQRSGKDVKTYKDENGKGVYLLDTAAGRMKLVPYPDADAAQQSQPEPSEYGLSTLNPKQLKELDKANVGPKQFDFEAIMAAYGSKQPFVGGGRDKTTGNYKRMVQARAVEYWQSKGLSPADAIAAQYEFTAIAHGAIKLSDVAARMTAANNNAIATAPVVKEKSKTIPRTDYPIINNMILNWQENIGNKKAPPFFIALETMAMDYGAALGMGNSVITDSRAQHARDLLKKGWSDGQLDAAIDQMLVELEREKGQALRGIHVFVKGAMAEAQGGAKSGGDKIKVEDLKGMSTEELEKLANPDGQ